LGHKCHVFVKAEEDPEAFLEAMVQTLEALPGWRHADEDEDEDAEDLSADDYDQDDDTDDDDHEQRADAIADIVGNVMSKKRAAMSSDRPKLKARLSHAARSKPIARRVSTAKRGKEIALQQLRASKFFAPKPSSTARLSHGKKTKGGPVSPARGNAAAREIVSNCPWLR
jgi:hypothetical protein